MVVSPSFLFQKREKGKKKMVYTKGSVNIEYRPQLPTKVGAIGDCHHNNNNNNKINAFNRFRAQA